MITDTDDESGRPSNGSTGDGDDPSTDSNVHSFYLISDCVLHSLSENISSYNSFYIIYFL